MGRSCARFAIMTLLLPHTFGPPSPIINDDINKAGDTGQHEHYNIILTLNEE